ncbi:MAG TPA: FAD-dependent oxidoreductase [Capillimicrobium sp.]|nr:FAD-dependent oxidoreductase [Capillimicrobium sp.]
MRRIVVVGASLAGLRAAQAARAAGFDGEIVLVGDEHHRPYTRPPLSKELLAGQQTPEGCGFPCEDLDVAWRLGVPASALDRERRTVVLADGDEVPYDRAIVATGCRARPWPGEGGDLPGVFTLRGIDDAIALRAAFEARPKVAIVGAGFVGCEVAATARKHDLDVTVIDIAPQPMLPLGPELGARCADLHRAHGVDLRLGAGVAGLRGGERVEAIELADGTTVDADVVVVALGALPNTEWLASSGLELDPGVACDPTLTSTTDPDVLAAGDAASWPHPLAGGERVRVEHWTVAAEHGQLAGRNAVAPAAERVAHTTPPYFWSDQYDVKIQAVGFPTRADALEILESTPDGGRFVAAGGRDGRLVGVVAFNAAKRLAWYRRQLAAGAAFDDVRQAVAADEGALGAPVGAAR